MSTKSHHFKCFYKCSKLLTFATAFTLLILAYLQIKLTFSWSLQLTTSDIKNFHLNKVCNNTVLPIQLNTEENWGPVDVNKTVYVISAYYVLERERVFVIGTKPFYDVTVICQLWFLDNRGRYVRQTSANVVAPIGARGYNFTSTIFECVLDSTDTPTYISMVTKSCDHPLNLLKVRQASKPEKYDRRFTVCLSPVFNYDNKFQLVEWVELNRILGAEKFIFYNYTTGVNVKNVIDYYVSIGLMEVVMWRIPFPPDGNIEYFAQKAVINDCIFRNKNVSEFIVNVDKDEYIIPNSYDVITWSQLFEKFDKNYAGYVVRHSFFRLDWKLGNLNFSEKLVAVKHNLVTLTHFEREKKIWPANHRSKYFARTESVEFGNVHEIPRGRIHFVRPEEALLHHYRTIGNTNRKDSLPDFTILVKYGDILTRNVQLTWKHISNV